MITPRTTRPDDGGFKYNPPNGGPADTDITKWIQDRANEILADGLTGRQAHAAMQRALQAGNRPRITTMSPPYVADLANVVDMDAIAAAGLKIGVDPLGGAGLAYWAAHRRDSTASISQVVNPAVDPTFAFMTVDHDGKIRMDCSSPYAMASLIGLKDRFDIAFGNDPDADRHGIVTPSAGLMNPNHYLAVAIYYLFQHRPGWRADAAVGKTLVSSSMIDRVAADLGRRLAEVPVGFKWFVDGLLDGSLRLRRRRERRRVLPAPGRHRLDHRQRRHHPRPAGRRNHRRAPAATRAQHYHALDSAVRQPVYERMDAPATPEQKTVLNEPLARDGDGQHPGRRADHRQADPRARQQRRRSAGSRWCTENGWFAARPSGTEDIYKIYAESFKGPAAPRRHLAEAQEIVNAALVKAGV